MPKNKKARKNSKNKSPKYPLSESPGSQLPTNKINRPHGISFSFKHLERKEKKFDYVEFNEKNRLFFESLIQRLKDYSTMNRMDLINAHSKATRCHSIDWKDTTENSFGLTREDDLVDVPFQLTISANRNGRIHGFFIDETFYIRWLDPHHNLYD